MSDHASFRATASSLLQKHGRPAVLSLKTANPGAKPWTPLANFVINLPATMMFSPTTMRDDKGTVVPGNFQKVFVASSDLETAYQDWLVINAPSAVGEEFPKLTTKDTVVDGGREYQIVRLGEVKPGEQSILFEMTIAG